MVFLILLIESIGADNENMIIVAIILGLFCVITIIITGKQFYNNLVDQDKRNKLFSKFILCGGCLFKTIFNYFCFYFCIVLILIGLLIGTIVLYFKSLQVDISNPTIYLIFSVILGSTFVIILGLLCYNLIKNCNSKDKRKNIKREVEDCCEGCGMSFCKLIC